MEVDECGDGEGVWDHPLCGDRPRQGYYSPRYVRFFLSVRLLIGGTEFMRYQISVETKLFINCIINSTVMGEQE